MAPDVNREQAEYWDERAVQWAESERHSDLVAGPFGEAAMARLDLQPGERVVDIGCGTGGTTVELAGRVGAAGDVLGVDIAAGMVAIANERHGGTAPRFTLADMQVDDLGGQRFDAAFSRFGIMFFADPTAAFSHIRSLLRPGGRLAFACWQDLFSNEWMFLPGSAVIGVTAVIPPMSGTGEPGPFSLSDAATIEAVLTAAGYSEVDVTQDDRVIDLPEAEVDSVTTLTRRIGPVREALKDADADLEARVLAAVREAFQAKVSDGRLRLSAGAHIVSAMNG